MKYSHIILAFIAALCLVLFALYHLEPEPLKRAKIVVHDKQTFQQLRQLHGLKATRMVVYEADGKAWYYKDGKKIKF